MANNYSVSNITTMEAAGESVAGGGIAPSAVLTITPHAGYVIQASDFSIGTTLPSEVTSVSFSDTTTALAVGNKVLATVNLATWFTMPTGGNISIDIDIDGTTNLPIPRLSFFNTMATTISNVTAALDIPAVTLPRVRAYSGVVTDGITLHTCYIDLPANQLTQVGTVTISAATDYHLTSMPSFRLVSSDYEKWSIDANTITYNADNQITSVVFDIMYLMGSTDVAASLGENIIWTVPTAEADKTDVVAITSGYYQGYADQAILPALDENLTLCVHGNEGSSYSVKIQDSAGFTYDFSSNTFTQAATDSGAQYIYSITQQYNLGQHENKNEHIITFPAFSRKRNFSQSFTTTITPLGSTKTEADGSTTEPLTTTLYQLGDVDFSLIVTAATHGETVSTTTIKSITDKIPFQRLTTFNPAQVSRSVSGNNGYFTTSQNIAYTTTDTVDDAGGFSGTTMTMDTSYVTKKVEVGDTVTGTNIAANTTIIATNVGSNAKVYTLSQSPSGTVADGTTITFTRTVGISRQPLTSDIMALTPLPDDGGGSLSNTISYRCKNAVSNSPVVELLGEQAGSSISNIIPGMLVRGSGIVGYPTVSSIVGNNIVLSSSQTLSASQVLNFSVAGAYVQIDELNVTGAGTSDVKLNMSGYVESMGNVDIVASLLLENFVTTYAVPTAATISAGTYSVPFGNSIKLEPIPSCTGHTGDLFIRSVSLCEGCDGHVQISNDEKSILYTAPLAGEDSSTSTTDVVTYSVKDDIAGPPSDATITVTLT